MVAHAVGIPLTETSQNRLKLAMDIGERTFSAVLFAGFAMRLAMALSHSPWDLLGIVNEGLVVVFIVFRRRTLEVSTRPIDWLTALVGTALPMLVRPTGHALAPVAFGLVVMLMGIGFSIWGKLILRRSFGLAAANRGVVSSGAYAFVRHPIYAGYTMFYIGFLSVNFSAWNVGVYGSVVALIVIRILAEERVLCQDPAYAAFMERVQYRLVPGLF